MSILDLVNTTLNTTKSSSLSVGAFYKGYQSLKDPSIQWDIDHLWDVCWTIPSSQGYDAKLPKPFDTWFPAIDVTEELASVQLKNFQAFFSTYNIAYMTSHFNISLTYYDTVGRDLTEWIADWINKGIFGKSGNANYIRTLSEYYRVLRVVKLDNAKDIVEGSDNSYMVIPDGNITYQGGSAGGLPQYQSNFIVVGKSQ